MASLRGPSCPVWEGQDFSQCFRQTYLDTALPLSLVGLSALVLVLSKIYVVRRRAASEQEVAKLDPAASSVYVPGAARQVFETENAVILNEVQSTPEDPVGPVQVAHIRKLDLFRCIIEIVGAVALVGLHTAAWATEELGAALPAGTPSYRWELVWAWVWVYFALISYWTLTTPSRLYVHKCIIQAVYFWVTVINLRSLLLSSDDGTGDSPHTLVVLTSLQLAVSVLLAVPTLFFPLRSKLPQHVRAIYRTMRAERKHGALGTVVPTPRRRRSRRGPIEEEPDFDVEENLEDSDEDLAQDARNAILRASQALEMAPDLTLREDKKTPISPELTASLYSRLLFGFMTPELSAHFRHQYSIDEVPEMKPEDSAAAVVSYFRSSSGSSSKSSSPLASSQKQRSLPLRLLIHFWPELSYQFVTAFLQGMASIAAPLGTQYILAFIKLRYRKAHDPDWTPEDGDVPLHLGITYAVLMFVGSLTFSILASQALMTGRKICCQIRAILITEIMTKALRRSALGGSKPLESSDLGDVENVTEEPEADEATGRATDGQVVNLISVDVFKVSEVCAYLHFVIPQSPVEVVLSLFFLVRLIGWSAIIGLLALVVMMPVQFYLSAWFLDAQKELLGVTDKRLDLTTEVLSAMKTVKFFAWEASFSERLNKIRALELSVLRRRILLMMLQLVSFRATPVLTTVIVFAVHTQVFELPLSAEVAFASLAYFALLKDGLETIPNQLPSVLGAIVSVHRISEYLQEDETTKYDQLLDFEEFGAHEHPYVGFDNASFTYASDEQLADGSAFVLKDLTITFPPGLSIIVGPVGSGKSSLLLSLLGETRRLQGRNFLPAPIARALVPIEEDGLSDSVAYASQSPWLLGTSVKENILFGLPFDEGRYRAVLRACALETDLKILEYHDETEVGEKGTALSGGQKARIALARALYSTARVLLIDDALSALDSSTSEYIYKHYLRGSLVKGRTIVMVTHAVSLTMPGASLVVALEGGKIAAQGSPEKVLESGLFRNEIQGLIKEDIDKHSQFPPTIEVLDEGQRRQEAAELKKKLDKKAQFTEEETIAEGAVSAKSYLLYFANFGSSPTFVALLWISVLVLYFAAQGSNIAATAWLKKWASRDDLAEKSTLQTLMLYSPSLRTVDTAESMAHPPMYHVPDSVYTYDTIPPQEVMGQLSFTTKSKWHNLDESTRYLVVYAALSLLYVVLDGFKQFVALSGSVIASGRIYRQLLQAILDATPGFFDRTPVGRIMNRMSKDLEGVDQDCSADLMFFADMVIQTAAILGIVIWGVPKFAFLTVALFFGFGWIGALYLGASRDLKRLESVQRSPIYTLIGEILSGNVLIRAYGDAGRFTRHCIRLIDRANRPFYALWLANRWLQLRIDALAAIITLVLSIFLIVSPGVDAALAGFIMSYAIMLVNCVLWVVRVYSMCEINLSSLERIDEYLELPPERLYGTEPPAYWPSDKGAIVFSHLGARYSAEFPRVLNDVSLTIKAGEKVGICGRTGSGKSSLLLTIFRFIEAEEGTIFIDGIDVSTVPIKTLRSRLTIIPQHPDIFQGTVRSNMDPFNEHEDAELWNTLERCRLVTHAEVLAATGCTSTAATPPSAPASTEEANGAATTGEDIEAFSGGVTITSLDMPVQQGGTNFSQGQRQLLALARGLLKLRDSRILILDESTASLDAESDAQIQATIRSELGNATLLTVAHRLRTIADYSKVLVLDKGKVLEYASPYELLQDPNSSFHELAVRSGEFDLLFEMAKKTHDEQQSA